ncbi:unnamed protein product, partial [Rotaria sp. Silwood2]
IHVFSRQQALVMNSGKPVYLQFMLIENGKLFYNLDIVGENYVSPNEITDQCLLTDIKRLIVDPTDTWLVTFEECSINSNSDDHQYERKHTFWKFNLNNNQFKLNTSVTYTYGQETLNKMLFHPHKLELATIGNDGFIKVRNFIQNPIAIKIKLCCSFENLVTVRIDTIDDITEESGHEYSRCFAHNDRKNPVEFNLFNCLNGQFIKSFSWHVHALAKDLRSSIIALFDKSFLHFYSFSDGKCHSRKSSLFRRVTSVTYIANEKSSAFAPLQHSTLIFYIPQEKTLDQTGKVRHVIYFLAVAKPASIKVPQDKKTYSIYSFKSIRRTRIKYEQTLNKRLGKQDIAVIMHTSGSTGTPKGEIEFDKKKITVQTGTLNDGVNLRLSILTRQHLHYRLSATAEDGQHIRFKSITSITLNQNGTINENNDRHLNTVLLKIAD